MRESSQDLVLLPPRMSRPRPGGMRLSRDLKGWYLSPVRGRESEFGGDSVDPKGWDGERQAIEIRLKLNDVGSDHGETFNKSSWSPPPLSSDGIFLA